MGLTKDFSEKPLEFLADYIVVVQDDSKGNPADVTVDFYLSPANDNIPGNNYVFLKKCGAQKPTEIIPAYWLPWDKGKANALTLGNKAKFMFTSELTNCRFSVLTGDMEKPKVAHVEGTEGNKHRDKLEVEAGFPERQKEEKLMRRLSITGIKNLTKDRSDTGPKHKYFGQSGETSSAFVFGYREQTTWKFYAQIVKGVMAGAGMNALKSATEKVVPLDKAYEIA
jgi:hypothetical protein